jgi:hypothetical protein
VVVVVPATVGDLVGLQMLHDLQHYLHQLVRIDDELLKL